MNIGGKFIVIIVSSLAIIGAVSLYLFRDFVIKEEAERLESLGGTAGAILEQSLANYMMTRDSDSLEGVLNNIKKSEGVDRIWIVNDKGIIKAGTDKEALGRKVSFETGDPATLSLHENHTFLKGSGAFRWVQVIVNKPECHKCHRPDSKYNGMIVLDFPTKALRAEVRRQILKGAGIILAAFIVIGLAMSQLSRSLIEKRLDRVIGQMRRFKEGRYTEHVPIGGNDEITRLAENFYEMAETIQRREKEKNETVQFLQRMIDTIHLPIFYKDAKGLYQGCNKAFETFLGLPRERIIGKGVHELYSPDLAAKYHEMDSALLRNPGVQVYEFEVKHSDGSSRDVMFNKATFTDADGRIAGLIGVMLDITDRKKMEYALASSENQLRAIIETEPECVKLVSSEGTIIAMNPAGLSMIEADSSDQVIGKSMDALTAPQYRPALEALTREVFRGNSGTLEFEIVGMKGTHRWLEMHAVPLQDAKDGISALLGVTRDITQRKKAEEEIGRNLDIQNVINTLLQVSLENVPLKKILERALDTVLSIPWLTLESKGRIFLNEDASDTLQMKAQKGLSSYLQEECGSIPFGKCLCGRAAATKELQFADRLDERHEVRYDGITPHGHYCIPILFSDKVLGVISLYLSEGHKRSENEVSFLKAIANVLAGIIQRKRVEDERETLISDLQLTLSKVSHSQRMWQETFDSIGDMMSIHDSDFNIIKVNRAFASYFGLSPKQVINKKCYEFFHSEGAPAVNCPHMTTMRDGVPATVECQDSRTKKIFLISTFPFYYQDANFHGSIHIAKDITEEREKEMRLIMSERLASLGQMASGIAHEINNPLAAIAGCAEGLLARVKSGKYDPGLFENYLRIIEEEIMRCKGITTGMLSFVRKPTYERRAVSLNEITDKTIELIGFQGRLHNIELVKLYADDMPTVEGNEGELRQVILILIMNALDAMGDSGKLQVQTGTEDRTAFIKVTDSGVGIPRENLSQIFGPFFTTKSDKGGTGLGLSIANEIVVNHNGVIYATSEEGLGSTFKVVLPMS